MKKDIRAFIRWADRDLEGFVTCVMLILLCAPVSIPSILFMLVVRRAWGRLVKWANSDCLGVRREDGPRPALAEIPIER